MQDSVVLRGYRYSVYNRIARMVLHEKSVAYDREEVDPFASDVPSHYLERHPFGLVPVLSHGNFDVYETASITRYIDAAFDGPSLVPVAAKHLARTAQVIAIVDSYGYRPLVRQVFAHRVFRPAAGEQANEAEVAAGLKASQTVLSALNALASERYVLGGQSLTLADFHLAPMIAYFVQAEEGADQLRGYSALADWWSAVSQRESLQLTDPGLPSAKYS